MYIVPGEKKGSILFSLIFLPLPFQQMLYMWSRNASGVNFPPDSGLPVGRGTGINLLVLQVHYVSNKHIGSEGKDGYTQPS